MAKSDSRILLAAQGLDTQGGAQSLVNSIQNARLRADKLAQNNITNERLAGLDALNLKQRNFNNERLVAQDARTIEKDALNKQILEQKIQAGNVQAGQVQEGLLNKKVNDLALSSQRALERGDTNLAADFAVQANTLIADSELPQESKLGLKTEIDSLVLDFNTNPERAKQTLKSFIGGASGTATIKKTDTQNLTTKDGKNITKITSILDDGSTKVSFTDSVGNPLNVTKEQVDNSLTKEERTIQSQLDKEIQSEANKTKAAFDKKFQETSGTKSAARQGETIDRAFASSRSVSKLPDIVERLKTLKTGKGISLVDSAANFFGIDFGGKTDRAEIAKILGENIVTQLKPIFGGSFSVQEGQWLKQIKGAIDTNSPEALQKIINDSIEQNVGDIYNGFKAATETERDQMTNNMGFTKRQADRFLSGKNRKERYEIFLETQEENSEIRGIGVDNSQNNATINREEYKNTLKAKYNL